jgi:hypothetical protein
MAKYDPNWLMKLKAKQYAEQERRLSHLPVDHSSRTMLCGRGWGAKGYPSIHVVMFPSVDNLPGCRSCREKYLESIGVEWDHNGYPKYSEL